uniref:Uncharacterized protein n=1 Tax=Globodera rostochiensis TaxID=31243 RepID=A0A914H0T3_GLORO
MNKVRKFGQDLQNEVGRVFGKTLSKEQAEELRNELLQRYKAKTDEAMERLYEKEEVRNMVSKLSSRKSSDKFNKSNIENSYDEEALKTDAPEKLIYGVTRPMLVAHKERLIKLRDQLRSRIEVDANERMEEIRIRLSETIDQYMGVLF